MALSSGKYSVKIKLSYVLFVPMTIACTGATDAEFWAEEVPHGVDHRRTTNRSDEWKAIPVLLLLSNSAPLNQLHIAKG